MSELQKRKRWEAEPGTEQSAKAATAEPAAEKPKFLSKAERQKLALERLEEERKARQTKEEEAQRARDKLAERVREAHYAQTHSGRDARDRARDADREEREKARKAREDAVNQERYGRDKNAEERQRDEARKQREQERVQKAMEQAKEQEQQAIRARYLGGKPPKKKIVKVTDKYRFSFDWEATEDTSRDLNPIYANKHEAQLLFGRGMKAGIDRREQKKTSTYVDELEKMRKKHGIATHSDDDQDDMDDE
mmetsp:Transcript_28431/g.61498  ORF Transcript_28431/g.61498 Transcript_28431/m.61498 type:complete len:251 (-) Transcript_28431:53-805(-)